MRKIELKKEGTISPRHLLDAVVKSPSPGMAGIDYAEQRRRMRLLDAVEKIGDEGGTLELEDADFDLLARLLKVYPFQLASAELVRFIDSVCDAPALK